MPGDEPTNPTPTPTDASAAAESVSQSEIENLLALVGGEPGAAQPDGPSTRHQFPALSPFTAAELRKLRVRQEEFVVALASRLSLHLRVECSAQLSKLETVNYRPFLDSLSGPTHLSLFKLEPLRGICLLDVPLRLALSIVDRELGGSAANQDDTRELSSIEVRLLSRVVEIIISEWCSGWKDMMDLRGALIGTENTGRFLEVHPSDMPMLSLDLELNIGEVRETMRFAFPCSMLQPMLQKLDQKTGYTEKVEENILLPRPLKWNSTFDDLEVNVRAELPVTQMSAKQVANLKTGDVIPLTFDMTTHTQLCLESTPRFAGSLGMCGAQLAIQIGQVIKT